MKLFSKFNYMYRFSFVYFLFLGLLVGLTCISPRDNSAATRQNVLLAISDDQSYPHTSAYGFNTVHTPGFDRLSEDGVLFTRAYAPAAPGCSLTSTSILTCNGDVWGIHPRWKGPMRKFLKPKWATMNS